MYKAVDNKTSETYKSKSTVTTHTMPRNTNSTGIDLIFESFEDGLRKFFGHVAIHLVPVVVRWICSVDIKSSASAEVVGIVFTFDVQSSCYIAVLANVSPVAFFSTN